MEKLDRATHVLQEDAEKGTVQIADEVVAIIAGMAATEIKGVASMAGNIKNERVAKMGMKSLSKGVKVEVTDTDVKVDLTLILKFEANILAVSGAVQEKVKLAIESMTGMNVSEVNVRVAGVALEAAVREELRRAEADLAVGGELRTGNVRVERVDVHARHAGQDLHAVAEQPEFVRPLQRAPVARGGKAVLRRGHALRRIRGASGLDAFHPVGFRGSGDMAEHGLTCAVFFQHAVGVAVPVAADDPAKRIGGIPVITDQG